MVDGSFYPDKSHLVAARYRYSSAEILLATGNFISLVELQYRNVFIAELCSYLAFFKFIEWVLDSSLPQLLILVTTGIDYASVINRISSAQLVTSFSTFLYQVV